MTGTRLGKEEESSLDRPRQEFGNSPAQSSAPLQSARDAAVARLTDAFGRDELTLDEFDRRVEAVYAAATLQDLSSTTADLPEPLAPMEGPLRYSALAGNVERSGPMLIPKTMEIRAFFGNVELDLRDAVFQPGVTEVEVFAVFGNIEIDLPPHVNVESGADTFLATCEVKRKTKQKALPISSTGTTIRLKGQAVLSNVEIKIR